MIETLQPSQRASTTCPGVSGDIFGSAAWTGSIHFSLLLNCIYIEKQFSKENRSGIVGRKSKDATFLGLELAGSPFSIL